MHARKHTHMLTSAHTHSSGACRALRLSVSVDLTLSWTHCDMHRNVDTCVCKVTFIVSHGCSLLSSYYNLHLYSQTVCTPSCMSFSWPHSLFWFRLDLFIVFLCVYDKRARPTSRSARLTKGTNKYNNDPEHHTCFTSTALSQLPYFIFLKAHPSPCHRLCLSRPVLSLPRAQARIRRSHPAREPQG